jgi:SM-20-related protein
MSNANLLTRLGLFINKEFLPRDMCKSICLQMSSSDLLRAEVRRAEPDKENKLDIGKRSAYVTSISRATADVIEARISNLKPILEEFFSMELRECEAPQFLVYKAGDFYAPHLDRRSEHGLGEDEDRRVSIVLFLNTHSEDADEGSYSGGLLTFYGLINNPNLKKFGFPLSGEEGLLAAFRSNIIHEVTPITRGVRYTAVTWFV